MKTPTFILGLLGLFITLAGAAPQFPICTWDPDTGTYKCPDPLPHCEFDPVKGEYVCPDRAVTGDLDGKA